jgi:hypothetical protein
MVQSNKIVPSRKEYPVESESVFCYIIRGHIVPVAQSRKSRSDAFGKTRDFASEIFYKFIIVPVAQLDGAPAF